MNGWTVAAFLVGFLVGVWMSYRKIIHERRRAIQTRENMGRDLSKRLFAMLRDAEVINITITEDGESEIKFDQAGLDELLGNKTRH